jgi:osmotically-inducible protein OsmY
MLASRRLTVLAFAAAISAGGCASFQCNSADCADDARIRAAVLQQIQQRPSLSTFQIDVQAHKHEVYLYGLVDTELDRGRAGDIAFAVPGVKKVYNALELQGNGSF